MRWVEVSYKSCLVYANRFLADSIHSRVLIILYIDWGNIYWYFPQHWCSAIPWLEWNVKWIVRQFIFWPYCLESCWIFGVTMQLDEIYFPTHRKAYCGINFCETCLMFAKPYQAVTHRLMLNAVNKLSCIAVHRLRMGCIPQEATSFRASSPELPLWYQHRKHSQELPCIGLLGSWKLLNF